MEEKEGGKEKKVEVMERVSSHLFSKTTSHVYSTATQEKDPRKRWHVMEDNGRHFNIAVIFDFYLLLCYDIFHHNTAVDT